MYEWDFLIKHFAWFLINLPVSTIDSWPWFEAVEGKILFIRIAVVAVGVVEWSPGDNSRPSNLYFEFVLEIWICDEKTGVLCFILSINFKKSNEKLMFCIKAKWNLWPQITPKNMLRYFIYRTLYSRIFFLKKYLQLSLSTISWWNSSISLRFLVA